MPVPDRSVPILPVLLLAGWLAPTSAPLAAQAPLLEQIAWLTGCWVRESPGRRVEERWLPPRAGAMLSVGRTIRDGKMVDYEFIVLQEQAGILGYEAHPAGQPATTFRTTEASDTLVIFRDPTHDFPQAVGYRRLGGDSLLAWIEGTMNGAARRIEFPYRRESCEAP